MSFGTRPARLRQTSPKALFSGAGLLPLLLCLHLPLSAQTEQAPAQPAPQPVRVFNESNSTEPAQSGATSTPKQNPEAPSPAVPATPPQTVGESHGPVQAIQLATPNAAKLAARKDSYDIKVSGSDWVDTHIVLAPSDRVQFTAKGSVTLGDGRKAEADGLQRGWKDLIRKFPANDAPAGALVGRIGNDPAVLPFAIGPTKELDVSTTGELYLAVNASTDLAPTEGAFDVKVKIAGKSGGPASSAASIDLSSLLSPALFASIPRRVQDQTGNPGDMVNFGLIGTEDQVTKAFANAGWVKVDKTTQDAIVHGLLATLSHQSYTEMPMSTLFLFGRSQDLSFARADPISVAAIRHHLRVWKTTESVSGRPLWVGSATHDNGFEKDQRNGGVTHHIDPEIDKERDFLEQSFAAAGNISAAAYVTPADPLRTAKTATGGTFESDGRIVVMDLR